jgi:hypothetical protein
VQDDETARRSPVRHRIRRLGGARTDVRDNPNDPDADKLSCLGPGCIAIFGVDDFGGVCGAKAMDKLPMNHDAERSSVASNMQANALRHG